MGLNDKAWETLFQQHSILEEVSRNGFFEIDADAIKKLREPRLMAKFDHRSNLPKVFRDHGLSILPLSRYRYVIGGFDAYQPITYDSTLMPVPMSFPSTIESIEPTNLYSESAALHCAYVSGMINDLMGEPSIPTVSGRMSSKSFGFHIQTTDSVARKIEICNSQIEIDGGYESENQLLLVEAKKETTTDFLIRQLYYPYRLWQDKVGKQVRPVFFTHSNDIFSFFVYEFTDPNNYNSLRLLYQKDYIIAHEEIDLGDILQVMGSSVAVQEPPVPFPQADVFARVVDLLGLLVESELSKDDITSNYNFDSRQTNYYTAAGSYLGLVERFLDESRTVHFRLTVKGRQIMAKPFKQKYLSLASCILEHEVFNRVLREFVNIGHEPDRARVIQIMRECNLYHVVHESTYFRRAQTVVKWIDWILGLQNV